MNVYLAKFDPDFLIFLVFILLPILGRVMRAIGDKKEGAPPPTPRRARPKPPERGDMADLERAGRDAWKRLLEGLGPAEGAQPEVVSVPEEEPPPPPPRTRVIKEKEHEDVERRGLPSERKERPRPAPSFESEPAFASGASSPTPTEMPGLGDGPRTTLARPAPRRRTRAAGLDVSPALLSGQDLRRAVVWSEILNLPVALRSSDGVAPGLQDG